MQNMLEKYYKDYVEVTAFDLHSSLQVWALFGDILLGVRLWVQFFFAQISHAPGWGTQIEVQGEVSRIRSQWRVVNAVAWKKPQTLCINVWCTYLSEFTQWTFKKWAVYANVRKNSGHVSPKPHIWSSHSLRSFPQSWTMKNYLPEMCHQVDQTTMGLWVSQRISCR